MYTDPELLDEVRDPIAEDETEIVETAEENERTEGEERVDDSAESDEDRLAEDTEESDEVSIAAAEGPETDT
jgi:hypothetical protein